MTVREIFRLAFGIGSPYQAPPPDDPRGYAPAPVALTAEDVDGVVHNACYGDSGAQRELGIMFYRGRGVPEDRSEAFKWLTLAMRQGDGKAEKFIEMIGPTLSADEAYEGRRRLAEITGEPLPPPEKEWAEVDDFSDLSESESRRDGFTVDLEANAASAEGSDGGGAAGRQLVPDVGEVPPPPVMLTPLPVGRRGWIVAIAACLAILGLAGAGYYYVVRTAGLKPSTLVVAQSSQKGALAPAKVYTDAEVNRLRPLADAGDGDAQFQLGLAFERGQGVPQDFAAAAVWYRKAAEQGSVGAVNNLGVLYIKGLGVKPDYVEAYQWVYLAARRGVIGAVRNRDQLSQFMTADQIAAALKKATALEAQLAAKR